ncbi:MAG TPA: low specificity L-threonine aldolase [Spirochaetes bacterium]|nr:low specificity L-threonine aldolase [Spirochaetota bacterium]
MIDLRSDTITKPTSAMRTAMCEAEVGDAVYGEDPVVNALEARTAELLGKEAAIFMPSGTMTNQVALRSHTEPGDEIVIDENAHNRGGGSVWPMERVTEIAALAKERGLAMHLDGARLWNAAVATGVPEKDWAAHFDTVSVCFSKGLGAPVGSALAGTAECVKRTRRFMKQFGGGMRQAGIIAAGALYALEHHRERLADDHANANLLAEGLAGLPGIELDASTVETNIVLIRLREMDPMDFMFRAHGAGVFVLPSGRDTVRAVTSMAVGRDDVLRAVEIIEGLLK